MYQYFAYDMVDDIYWIKSIISYNIYQNVIFLAIKSSHKIPQNLVLLHFTNLLPILAIFEATRNIRNIAVHIVYQFKVSMIHCTNTYKINVLIQSSTAFIFSLKKGIATMARAILVHSSYFRSMSQKNLVQSTSLCLIRLDRLAQIDHYYDSGKTVLQNVLNLNNFY